jgi:two-component system, LuxR family, sensor kinase FixL
VHSGLMSPTSVVPPEESAAVVPPPLTLPKWLLLAAVGYGVGVRLGMALTLTSEPVSTLWPANAFLSFVLLLTPPRKWWLVLLCAFPAHLLAEVDAGVPLSMSVLWFVSNSAEAGLCAALLLRFLYGPPRLDRVRDVSLLVAVAGIVAPVLSSFLDAGFVALNGWRYAGYWQVWEPRTLSNSLGALIVIPLIAALCAPGTWRRVRQMRVADWLEALLLIAGLSIVSILVFQQPHLPNQSPVLIYAPLPFLILAAVRQGTGFVALCTAIVALLAIQGLIHGHGPFTDPNPERAALALQTSLVITSVSLMLLAAALAELRHARGLALSRLAHLDLALTAAKMGTWQWDLEQDRISWSGIDAEASATLRSGSAWPRDFLKHVAPDDRSALIRTFHEPPPGTCEAEFRLRNDAGSFLWISAQGKAVRGAQHEQRGVIGVYGDITRRKSEEADRAIQSEQVARLSRASLLGVVSGALAHDLLQPLTAILGNTDAALVLLRRQAANVPAAERGAGSETIEEALADVRTESLRMIEIIRNTRALFERGEVSRDLVDVNECVEAALRLERSYLIARGATIDLRLAPGLPRVVISGVELQQVLINLIVNACEAMDQTPAQQRRIEMQTFAGDGGVEIVVADSGVGLKNAQRIFEPFFTSKPHGIGLGLAICRAIITAHWGKLWATNRPTGGAALHVLLPATSE